MPAQRTLDRPSTVIPSEGNQREQALSSYPAGVAKTACDSGVNPHTLRSESAPINAGTDPHTLCRPGNHSPGSASSTHRAA